jgi:hypothetical protein
MNEVKETDHDILIRIDENVEFIKKDYMTKAKADLIVERAVTKHERKQHKGVNIAAFTALLTAVATMIGAVIYAFV